jgi:regulator of RNase E activity RraA
MIQPREPMLVPVLNHWRVDALRHDPPCVTEYNGHDQAMAGRIVGRIAMEAGVEGIVVYRNGDEYRRFEVK